MKTIAILTLFASTVSLAGAPAPSAPVQNTVYYELKLKSENLGDMGTRKMWIKGDKMRWESSSADVSVVLIKNGEGVYLVKPSLKLAGKYPQGTNRSNPKTLFSGPIGAIDIFLKHVKAVKHGTETISKEKCDVYTYTDSTTGFPCKIWVNPQTKKPVQLVLDGKKAKADTITAKYTRFEPGAKVEDKLFQVPSGYAVRPMPKSELASKKQTVTKPG